MLFADVCGMYWNIDELCIKFKRKKAAQPHYTRVQRGVDLSGGRVCEGGQSPT